MMSYKRIIRILILAGLSAAFLFDAAGCSGKRNGTTEILPSGNAAPGEETVVYQGGSQEEEEYPSIPPTRTPRPTPDPAATPEPSRAPIEGDVTTTRFPNSDTGWNADWSYQSDELRIAITRYENQDDHIVYYVADIWMRNINCFRTELANGKYDSGREDPVHFANRVNAIFGISGTMNSGLVIHNGKQIKKSIEDSDIAFRSGIVIVYRDGVVKMIDRHNGERYNYKKEDKEHGGILHALQFGPVLVQNGKIRAKLKTKERHPRIIFGYCEPGHYIAVAVDGRTKRSVGMTEQEMAELMLSLGCTDAINLDGGNSAVMLFMGQVINVPSGKDKDGDGVAGRNILDLLAFAEYDEDGSAQDLSTVHADHILGE